MSRRSWGIDVSHHNGPVDWGLVAGNGATFSFCKATEGVGWVDPMFERNFEGIREASMFRGAYHFARVSKSPDIQGDARAEADHFLHVFGTDRKQTLPPVLDLEWDKKARGVRPDEVIDWALAWLEHVEDALNQTPILYTGRSFWRYKLAQTDVFQRYPLWLAQYKKKRVSGKDVPAKEIPEHPWAFWQFTSSAKVAGVSSKKCDVNYFLGGRSNLALLAHGRNVSEPAQPLLSYSFATPSYWDRFVCWGSEQVSRRDA